MPTKCKRKVKIFWVRLYTRSYSAYDINGKFAINDAHKRCFRVDGICVVCLVLYTGIEIDEKYFLKTVKRINANVLK